MAHRLDPTDSGGRDISQRLAGVGSSSSHRSAEARLIRETDTSQTETENSLEPRGVGSRRDEDGATGSLRQGYGRIVRDETGAIVDVILAEEVRKEGGEDAESDSMVEDYNGFENGEERPRGTDWEGGQEAAWLLRSVGEDAHVREDGKTRTIVQGVFSPSFSIGDVPSKWDILSQEGGNVRASLRIDEVLTYFQSCCT